MCRVGATLTLCLCLAAACRGDRGPAPAPPEIVALDVGPASAPRDPPVLVAGEQARIGLRIRGGAPPYRVAFESRVLRGELSAQPAARGAAGVEVAALAAVDRDAPTGRHSLTVAVTDAAGAATRTERALDVVGAGSEQTAPPGDPPWVRVIDAGGRRRAELLRGERVNVRGRLPEGAAGEVEIALADATGAPLASLSGASDDGSVDVPLQVPRLARPGDYTLSLAAGDARAETRFRIAAAPFSNVEELTADALAVYGGADRRADRKARLVRGETVAVELRVGGARREVSGAVRLRDRAGEVAAETELPPARPALVAPDARSFVAGTWRVPAGLAPGRYTLEAEAREGDHVSTLYREVRVD